jgi:hypothetical protein
MTLALEDLQARAAAGDLAPPRIPYEVHEIVQQLRTPTQPPNRQVPPTK